MGPCTWSSFLFPPTLVYNVTIANVEKTWTFLGNKPKTNWKGYTPALVFHRNMVIAKEKDQSSHVQTIKPENILTQTEANRFEPFCPNVLQPREKKQHFLLHQLNFIVSFADLSEWQWNSFLGWLFHWNIFSIFLFFFGEGGGIIEAKSDYVLFSP